MSCQLTESGYATGPYHNKLVYTVMQLFENIICIFTYLQNTYKAIIMQL